MKAIRIHSYGDADVLRLEEVESPKPDPGEAVVRQSAIGVNYRDTGERASGPARRLPFTPGVEAAGVVQSVGEGVSVVQAGQRVAYVVNKGGAYAEEVVVPADQLIPLPDEIAFETAAAISVNGMTAHYLLHDYRKVTPGTHVLIHAAAGGMGLVLTQWAKHMGGTVIGTVSTEEKAAAARAAGADHIIRYIEQDFVEVTKRITGGRGVDLVIDGVGKTTLAGSLEAVRNRGYVVVYGKASGTPAPVDPLSLVAGSRRLAGGDLFDFIAAREELLMRADATFDGLRNGFLKLHSLTTLPLADAAKAHRLLENRGNIGKIVLTVT